MKSPAARRLANRMAWGLRGLALLLLVLVMFSWISRDDLRDFFVDDHRFEPEITAAARRHGLDPLLVRAVVFQESRFDPFARGGKGEVGLMQLLPAGAVAEYARAKGGAIPSTAELTEPNSNLEIGCWYLARARSRWSGYRRQDELALCQYNAGESRAVRWAPPDNGEVIPRITIDSTRRYVGRIMRRYEHYREERSR